VGTEAPQDKTKEEGDATAEGSAGQEEEQTLATTPEEIIDTTGA